MNKSILIYYEKDSSSAPRVHSQLRALIEEYEIILATENYSGNFLNHSNLTLIELPKRKPYPTFHLRWNPILRKISSLILKIFDLSTSILSNTYVAKKEPFWDSHYKAQFNTLIQLKFDLIICHHTASLPLMARVKKNSRKPLILNTHEYYPLEFEDKLEWLLKEKPKQDYICKKYLPLIDNMFCVGTNIGQKYQSEFGIKQFRFIPNDKPFFDLPANKVKNKVKIIHHGACVRSRSLMEMVKLMAFLPKESYELDLMLTLGDKEFYAEIEKEVTKHEHVQLIEPVNHKEIIPFTNKYDLGLFILPPLNFNYKNALPNKFFEFLQAKLCICISPNPEMKSLVEKFNLGVVAEGYTSKEMANRILDLSHQNILFYKNQALKHSQDLSSEKTEELIKNSVRILIT